MSLFKTTEEQKARLYEIAILMKQNGLDERFVESAVKLAEIYEGAFDLFCLWAEEEDESERTIIVNELKKEIVEFWEWKVKLLTANG